MSNNSEKALETFSNGYNCSQAVFSTLGPSMGIKREDCLKIASGFGAGMGVMQNTCGAVSGAIMLIGLKFGKFFDGDKESNIESKQKVYSIVREFAEKFKKRNATISCRDLLGMDISTEEGMNKAREINLFERKCNGFVKDAIEIVQELFSS